MQAKWLNLQISILMIGNIWSSGRNYIKASVAFLKCFSIVCDSYTNRSIMLSLCINFCLCNSKISGLIRPKIELNRAIMPVLVTNNFADDSIKNERASTKTPFSHYKSMGSFLESVNFLSFKGK